MATDSVTVPSLELSARIAKLQKSLAEKDMDGALISQKTDLFYFGATSQQGWLYVPVSWKTDSDDLQGI